MIKPRSRSLHLIILSLSLAAKASKWRLQAWALAPKRWIDNFKHKLRRRSSKLTIFSLSLGVNASSWFFETWLSYWWPDFSKRQDYSAFWMWPFFSKLCCLLWLLSLGSEIEPQALSIIFVLKPWSQNLRFTMLSLSLEDKALNARLQSWGLESKPFSIDNFNPGALEPKP